MIDTRRVLPGSIIAEGYEAYKLTANQRSVFLRPGRTLSVAYYILVYF